jgi:CheY-like chemotaxis protein
MTAPRVLIVDDNPQWRDTLVRLLSSERYLTRSARDKSDALSVLREEVFHAALVDVHLEGEDDEEGVTLAQEIRARYPHTGVILITGYNSTRQQAVRVAQQCGALGYIEKWPSNRRPEDVLSEIKFLIEKSYKGRFVCFKTGGDCAVQTAENPRVVFVAMPFRSAQNNLYQYGLLPLERTLDCDIKRADEEFLNTDLMCKICQMIQEARVCIADITGWNANVLFELGLMYGRGKQVILIKHEAEKREKVDLKGMAFIPYALDDYEGLQDKLKNALQKHDIRPRQGLP